MAGSDSLTDQIRGWFERSPKAQRAVKRIAEDLDVVAGHVDKATSGLMEKVGPIIDPPASVAAPDQAEPMATSTAAPMATSTAAPTAASSGAPTAAPSGADTSWTGFSSNATPAPPDSGSSVPPGVKKDGEPVEPDHLRLGMGSRAYPHRERQRADPGHPQRAGTEELGSAR